jgi:hypothetical protein
MAGLELVRRYQLSSHPAAPSEQTSRNPFRVQILMALDAPCRFAILPTNIVSQSNRD